MSAALAKAIKAGYSKVAKLKALIHDAKAQGKRDLARQYEGQLDKVNTKIASQKASILNNKPKGNIYTLGAKARASRMATVDKEASTQKQARMKKTARQNAAVDRAVDSKKKKLGNIGKAHRSLLESNFDTRSPKIVVDVNKKNDEVVEQLQALQALRENPKAMRNVKLPGKEKKVAPKKKEVNKQHKFKITKSINSKRGE